MGQSLPIDRVLEWCGFLLAGIVVGRHLLHRSRIVRGLARSYDVALDLHCTAGFDGYMRSVNPAWTQLLGYSRRELLGTPLIEFVHPDDRERTLLEIERQTATDMSTASFHNRWRAADGSYRWLDWTSRSVVRDGVIYATARDVTEQKRDREELERLVRRRTEHLHAARLETLRRLALAAEYRDDDTNQHTERVGKLSALLAELLGAAPGFVEHIRHAAPLHDVGKLGLPDSILLKPGRLASYERDVMRTHTTIGARILADSEFPILRLGETIAATHHERWDGRGYPNGLAGSGIPLAGRIVAVADVFDALTHARPYKPAWPLEDAVAEIVSSAGTKFDPEVVDAFQMLHAAGELDAFLPEPRPARRALAQVHG